MNHIISDSLQQVNTVSLIHKFSELVFNPRMKIINEIRRDNLLILIKEAGGTLKLAEAYGCTEAAIKTMLNAYKDSKSGTPKGIGPSSARKLEECMGKERGWLDHEQGSAFSNELTDDERTVLTGFRLFDPAIQKYWITMAEMRILEVETANRKRS